MPGLALGSRHHAEVGKGVPSITHQINNNITMSISMKDERMDHICPSIRIRLIRMLSIWLVGKVSCIIRTRMQTIRTQIMVSLMAITRQTKSVVTCQICATSVRNCSDRRRTWAEGTLALERGSQRTRQVVECTWIRNVARLKARIRCKAVTKLLEKGASSHG